MTVHKSPYAKLAPGGKAYEFGVVMQRPGERDIMFAQGTAPDHDSAIAKAHEIAPRLLDYFASATYATPAGGVGHWSSVVLALHHAGAMHVAKALIERQRKVAGKLDIKVHGPGEQKPLVSLPDLAVILHNANIQSGGGVPFEKIAADILAYQVPTPPQTDAMAPPAPLPRDAMMMIAVQNIVRAALREIDKIEELATETRKLVAEMATAVERING